jgi:CBS domain-containing protein
MNTPISALLERKGPTVQSVSPGISISAAVSEMNRHKIGCLVVLENERLAGIFTERDVLKRVVGAGIDPRTGLVADVMTSDVVTITPDTTVNEVMEIFTDKRCRHLPVISGGRLAGLISIGDVSRWMVDIHRAECEHLKSYITGGFPA